jgi:phage baseplate assembly protein W
MTELRSGIAFPFRFLGGRLAGAQGMEKVRDDLRHLISTRLAERPMLRGYGGGVHRHVQDPNSGTLRALLRHELEQAIRLFMPELRLTAPIQVLGRESELTVIVEYRADPRIGGQRLELRIR